jgi:hypothetical protein
MVTRIPYIQKRCNKRQLLSNFFFFGIRICYTLHVCKYKDVCGQHSDPIGKNGNNVILVCVVIWRVVGVV